MLNKLLEALTKQPSTNVVFNQYLNPQILENLRLFLTYLIEQPHNILLIGEAPGYKGCRLTGIPFTSGAVIKNSKHEIFRQIGDKINLPKIDSESTASIFWEFFDNNQPIPILWNAFPFHPHIDGNPDSNRKPTQLEIEAGKQYLLMIYNIFRPKTVCSLGRVGQTILKELFPSNKIIYIRHPSYGGKNAFTTGISALY